MRGKKKFNLQKIKIKNNKLFSLHLQPKFLNTNIFFIFEILIKKNQINVFPTIWHDQTNKKNYLIRIWMCSYDIFKFSINHLMVGVVDDIFKNGDFYLKLSKILRVTYEINLFLEHIHWANWLLFFQKKKKLCWGIDYEDAL